MTQPTPDILYAGMEKSVAAIDAATGIELWRRKLPKGGSLVNILIKGDVLFVSTDGYVYCLDRYMGELIWRNDMKRLGYGPVMLATPDATGASTNGSTAAAIAARQAAAAAAAG